jgi:hypothetical protein
VESRYDTRVKALLDSNPEDAIEYMLRAMPLIKEYTSVSDATPPDTRSQLDSFGFHVTSTSNKNDVFCRYMADVEGDHSYCQAIEPKKSASQRNYNAPDWTCTCGAAKFFDRAEAALICPGCGIMVPYMEMNQHNLSFDEQISMESSGHCAYRRVNHFSEWLNSLQARESTVIPEEILEAVRAEFRKARATTRADITPRQVKSHLKKLRLSKFYEHTYAICNALNGTPAPKLSPAVEARLKSMFNEIEAPFEKWKFMMGPKRKNMLNCGYCLYKMCELLGEDDLLSHFALLKSQDKLYQMDAVWKKICAELHWEYIPTR